MLHSGEVRGGRLVVDQPARLAKQISKLEGKRVRVEIKEAKPIRSIEANSYYWVVVIPAWCDYTGYDPEEMHDALKGEHLTEIRILPNGDEMRVPRSTTGLTSDVFAEYIDWCKRKGAGYGIQFSDDPRSYEVEQ